jgi:phage protein D
MADNLYTSNAPVFLVEGERQGGLARDLVRLEIEEDCLGLKRLAARFTAWGPKPGGSDEVELYLDGSLFDFGKKLEVSMGPADNARTVFKGAVSAIEAAYREGCEPEAVIFAEDALMKLRFSHRFKTYENVSDADIVRAVAAEHGLTAEAEAEGPTHKIVQQWNMSDLAFLRERARLLQAEIWMEDNTLNFKTRDQRHGTDVILVNGNHLVRIDIRADLSHQRSEVYMGGYDVAARDKIDEHAGADAVRGEASGGRLGTEILGRAFSEYKSYRVREVPLSGEAASAWAKADMLRRSRGFVRVKGVTRGTPDLAVGSRVTLERVAPPFAGGSYYVTRVSHTYDLANGHRTAFEAERPHVEGA